MKICRMIIKFECNEYATCNHHVLKMPKNLCKKNRPFCVKSTTIYHLLRARRTRTENVFKFWVAFGCFSIIVLVIQ